MITLEQYTKAVKTALKQKNIAFKDADVLNSYLNEQKTKDTINEDYNFNMARLKSGEITEAIVLNGCANSTAYCLDLMY